MLSCGDAGATRRPLPQRPGPPRRGTGTESAAVTVVPVDTDSRVAKMLAQLEVLQATLGGAKVKPEKKKRISVRKRRSGC